MSSVKILPKQTLFDIAVQECGSIEAVFEIARTNNLSITAELPAGTIIILPEVYNRTVKKVYQDNGYKPASISDTNFGGIGFWTIGDDFIVGGSTDGIGFWTIGTDFIIN